MWSSEKLIKKRGLGINTKQIERNYVFSDIAL